LTTLHRSPADAALMDVSESMESVHEPIEITQVGYRLGNQAIINAALASLRSSFTDGRVDVDGWIKAISRVYAIVTDLQDIFVVCMDLVKPLNGVLLAVGVQHIHALMFSEEGTFEEVLQASGFLRHDWSRTLEWHYRDA
jgi:hypothetical protein